MADKMRVLLVLSFEFEEPDEVTETIRAIDPMKLPGFQQKIRIVLGETALNLEEMLDES